jgi:glycosyltransferase involved in cell wall biosynthesis
MRALPADQSKDLFVTSIVVACYRPHKPDGGAPLRNWQNINVLASLGPVDVVTVGVEEANEPIECIREWVSFSRADRSTWDRVKTACSPLRPGVYPGIDLYHSRAVTSWIRRRASRRRYDLGVLETIATAAYLGDLKQAARRVVFDAHNVESTLNAELAALDAGATTPFARRVKNRILHWRLMAAEQRIVRGADLVWTCSDFDARQIERMYARQAGVTVVPNGVDVDAYQRAGTPPPSGDWSRLPVTMVYPGLFAYSPNEDAALRLIREVLPAVRARGYRARVVLVGRNPTPALVDAARQADGVEVTGAVESVVPYLHQPCVVTLPIATGSGTRLKILEAFAARRPVVSTSKGAEGIDATDEEHLLIRDHNAIADAVIDLWRRPQLRERICDRALDLVRSRYSWSVANQRIAQSLGMEPRSGQGRARALGGSPARVHSTGSASDRVV